MHTGHKPPLPAQGREHDETGRSRADSKSDTAIFRHCQPCDIISTTRCDPADAEAQEAPGRLPRLATNDILLVDCRPCPSDRRQGPSRGVAAAPGALGMGRHSATAAHMRCAPATPAAAGGGRSSRTEGRRSVSAQVDTAATRPMQVCCVTVEVCIVLWRGCGSHSIPTWSEILRTHAKRDPVC